ncbi:hypothetical protein MCANUFG4_02401 [Mycoplasmopsis canis UFG4]|uniref:Uncharacterized protein n=1 Tax=Mycoplasmopsis canis UFG4 TaxID=1131455 RepID=I1A5W8_9BACT|nr:hypothetical protein [Mycoplasmopsis canis]EIE41889.1 hypothetical protein MCANUFG4_02401 [Mycoplasmopsis canis UFG4]
MNIFHYLIILLLFAFLIVILVGFLIISYLYYRSSSGIINFKVDKNNNRVIRISNKYHFLSTIFDSQNSNFKEFNFLSLNDFLDYFKEDSRDKISKYFEGFIPEGKSEVLEVYINSKYRKNFSLIDRILVFLDKTITRTPSYTLTIHQDSASDYICSLKWSKISHRVQKFRIKEHSKNAKFEIKEKNTVVIGALIKPEFYLKNLRVADIYEIYSIFNFSPKKTFYFKEEGMVYFVLKNIKQNKYKEYVTIINDLNQSSNINKVFSTLTIFKFHEIVDEKNKLDLKNVLKYSLYNIYCRPQDIDLFINFDYKILQEKKFIEFSDMLNKYDVLNNSSENDFFIRKSVIVKYNKNEKGNLYLYECQIKNLAISDSWIRFFKQIPYLEYKYQKIWYNYIADYSRDNTQNPMVKISQEVFLDKQFNVSIDKPLCLVYANNNAFMSELLKEKILKNSENKIYTALYIETIDRALINIINTVDKLKVIIIGEKISQNLSDWSVAYDCLSIISLAKTKNIQVVFENPKKDLDELIVEKLNIKYAFDSSLNN